MIFRSFYYKKVKTWRKRKLEYNKIKVLDFEFYVAKNDKGITYIDFNDDFAYCFKNENMQKIDDNFEEVRTQLEEYFLGKRKVFDFKCDLVGSAFDKKVWGVLKDLPYNTTTTYSQLADGIGDKKKARAVANSVGKNPLLIVVPCHRVIGKDGKLHGFRAGIDKKKLLLKLEKDFSKKSKT